MDFSLNGAGAIGNPCGRWGGDGGGMNLDPYRKPFTKIKLRWNIKVKAIKILEKTQENIFITVNETKIFPKEPKEALAVKKQTNK